MKRILFLILIFFSLVSLLYAQNFAKKEQKLIIAQSEKSLKIGEKLEYSLEWIGIPIGTIVLESGDIEKVNGTDCYHIIARARPNKFLAKFYDIEYTVDTYIDTKNLYTLRFKKARRLRGRVRQVIIDFNRNNNLAKFITEGDAESLLISPQRGELEQKIPIGIEILHDTQDLFSSLYQLRLMELKEGNSYSIHIYYDQRSWNMNVKIERPFIKDIRRKGEFTVFRALMESDLGSYILGKSKFYVYFTADSRRIPVEFKLGTGLGTMRGIIKNLSD